MACRKRRSWSVEEKRSICSQTLAPGVSVSKVARRHAMNANQIFNWLKDPRFAPAAGDIETDEALFLPVEVTNSDTMPMSPPRHDHLTCHSNDRSNGRIEVELTNGHRLTVGGSFDGAEVARLLKGLLP